MNKTELNSNRLKLSLIIPSDLGAIHELHSLPEVDQFNTLGIPENLEETKSILSPWIEGNSSAKIQNFTFAIRIEENGAFIGLIALKLGTEKFKIGEVWYKLHSNYWGNGFASEALRRLISFGFDELKLHRIEAGCAVDNIGSIRVLEKSGFTREGRKREVLPLKSGWSDNYHFAILENDERNA